MNKLKKLNMKNTALLSAFLAFSMFHCTAAPQVVPDSKPDQTQKKPEVQKPITCTNGTYTTLEACDTARASDPTLDCPSCIQGQDGCWYFLNCSPRSEPPMSQPSEPETPQSNEPTNLQSKSGKLICRVDKKSNVKLI